MMIARALLLLATGLLAATQAEAGPPRSVDVRGLDIAGVRTGMDFEEARTALARHFGVGPDAIKADPFPGENPVTHTKLPSYLTFEKDGTKITVHFEGRVPVDSARLLAASLVSYETPWSNENAAAMLKAASAKYGIASNAPNTLPMQWCARPSANPGIGCGPDQARLELSQTRLSLGDPAWATARIKFQEDARATKPNL
jgi:hypothetical protein